MGRPAARVTDKVLHPIPGILSPGPGSMNVSMGGLPAWRGIPGSMAVALQAAKKVSDTALQVAAAATKAAMGTPAAPAAVAAEEAAKIAASTAMSSLISGMASAAGAATLGAGAPDIHNCLTPLPAPPHGPGMVIDGSRTVLVNGLPACRLKDNVLEALGPLDPIVQGLPSVLIGDLGATGIGPLDNAIAKILNAIDKAAQLLDAAKAMATGVAGVVGALANKVIDFVKDTANRIATKVASAVTKVMEWMKDLYKRATTKPEPPPPPPLAPGQHHTQHQYNSCVAASIRNMILMKTGKDIPEETIRQALREACGNPDLDFNTQGIDPKYASQVLEAYGVPCTMDSQVNNSKLADLTKNGPVLIGFKEPSHRVMLDHVEVDAKGNRTYIVRDPDPQYGGIPRKMDEKEFNSRYNYDAPVIIPK